MDVDSDLAATSKPTKMDLEDQARHRRRRLLPPTAPLRVLAFMVWLSAMVVTVLGAWYRARTDGREGEGESRGGGEREGRGARGHNREPLHWPGAQQLQEEARDHHRHRHGRCVEFVRPPVSLRLESSSNI
jgi:hypothetical protein